MILCARMSLIVGLAGLCAGGFADATTQTKVATPVASDATILAPVYVIGSANAAQIRYRDLLAGVAAFNKYRHYAPNAILTFFLRSRTKTAASSPLSLNLQTSEDQLDIPITADGQFELPLREDVVGYDDAYLVANRPSGAVGVVPVVRSPGDTGTELRLGDLRLQCEVSWAIEKQNVPKSVRSFFYLAGGVCHSSKIAVNYFLAPQKLRKVVLSHAGRQVDVVIQRDGRTYWPPLGESKWSDDASVSLTFDDAIPE